MALSPILCFSQNNIDNTGSNISPGDAQAILAYHNKVRSDLNIPPLAWNSNLASFAQSWADSLAIKYNCKLIHRQPNQYGENIYGGYSSDSIKPVSAAIDWYSEIKQYTYRKISEENWYNTGHYTQMIWKNTTEVGVGMATCPGGGVVIVANYNPPGNYMGEYPY
jgi:uncharacterized protein YkwD